MAEVEFCGELLSNWRKVKTLGQGGFGEVLLLHSPSSGKYVAVKNLLKEEPTHKERLNAEIVAMRSLAGIQHACQILEAGSSYIAMEYYCRGNLANVLSDPDFVSDSNKRQALCQILQGLHQAHRIGIIHRDLKPENILVDADGVLHISDWGLAKVPHLPMTQTGQRMGTPGWGAPEQFYDAKSVTPATDIYAVGHLIKWMWHDAVPRSWQEHVSRMLSIDPTARYGTSVPLPVKMHNHEPI
jgi:serine/threonine protein kinase